MATSKTVINEPEFGIDANRKPVPVLGQRFGQAVDTATTGAAATPVRHKLGVLATTAVGVFPNAGGLTPMASYRFTIALETDLANGIPPNVYYRFGTTAEFVATPPIAADAVSAGWFLVSTSGLREFVRKVPRGLDKIAIQNPGAASIRIFAERMD